MERNRKHETDEQTSIENTVGMHMYYYPPCPEHNPQFKQHISAKMLEFSVSFWYLLDAIH